MYSRYVSYSPPCIAIRIVFVTWCIRSSPTDNALLQTHYRQQGHSTLLAKHESTVIQSGCVKSLAHFLYTLELVDDGIDVSNVVPAQESLRTGEDDRLGIDRLRLPEEVGVKELSGNHQRSQDHR